MKLPLEEAQQVSRMLFWAEYTLKLLEDMLDKSENEYYFGESAKIELRNALRSLKLLEERGK